MHQQIQRLLSKREFERIALRTTNSTTEQRTNDSILSRQASFTTLIMKGKDIMKGKGITVVGAGPVGIAVARALQALDLSVTIIAERVPGEGISAKNTSGFAGDLAAGIGRIFEPENILIRTFLQASYPVWMALADQGTLSVRRTSFHALNSLEEDPAWANLVRDYERKGTTATYTTYVFDPVRLGEELLAEFQDRGGRLIHRALTQDECTHLAAGNPIHDCYTVIASGLNMRELQPQLGLHPVRGVLVHFHESQSLDSYLDESAGSSCYVVSRPNAVVIGGTTDKTESVTDEEKLAIGERLVRDANQRFGLRLDFAERTRITVGYRPTVQSGLALEIDAAVAYVGGLGGRGWVTSPALAAHVASRVIDRL